MDPRSKDCLPAERCERCLQTQCGCSGIWWTRPPHDQCFWWVCKSRRGFHGVAPSFVKPLAVGKRNPPVLLFFMCLKGDAVKDENISRQKTVKKLISASSLSVTDRLFGSQVECGRLGGKNLTLLRLRSLTSRTESWGVD